MKKLLVLSILALFSLSMAANQTAVADKTTSKASRVQTFGSGAYESVTMTGTDPACNIAVTGAGWYVVRTLGNGASISMTTISGGTIGDVIVLSPRVASENVVVIDGTTIATGGDRTLNGTADALGLLKVSATLWTELFFVDNN